MPSPARWSQMQDDLRRDYVTGVYNSVYLNEVFRPAPSALRWTASPWVW